MEKQDCEQGVLDGPLNQISRIKGVCAEVQEDKEVNQICAGTESQIDKQWPEAFPVGETCAKSFKAKFQKPESEGYGGHKAPPKVVTSLLGRERQVCSRPEDEDRRTGRKPELREQKRG